MRDTCVAHYHTTSIARQSWIALLRVLRTWTFLWPRPSTGKETVSPKYEAAVSELFGRSGMISGVAG